MMTGDRTADTELRGMADCLVLAAGASSRMEEWKPLLRWGSTTLVGEVVATARSAGCSVILVAGYREKELSDHGFSDGIESNPGVIRVFNPVWEEGMTGSIQSALPLVRTASFFVMLADMPLVDARVYTLLARESVYAGHIPPPPGPVLPIGAKCGVGPGGTVDAGCRERALFAGFGGRAGHPVLIPSAWIPGILGLAKDARMRDYLDSRGSRIVETGCPGVLVDLDTREEYLRHRPRE